MERKVKQTLKMKSIEILSFYVQHPHVISHLVCENKNDLIFKAKMIFLKKHLKSMKRNCVETKQQKSRKLASRGRQREKRKNFVHWKLIYAFLCYVSTLQVVFPLFIYLYAALHWWNYSAMSMHELVEMSNEGLEIFLCTLILMFKKLFKILSYQSLPLIEASEMNGKTMKTKPIQTELNKYRKLHFTHIFHNNLNED